MGRYGHKIDQSQVGRGLASLSRNTVNQDYHTPSRFGKDRATAIQTLQWSVPALQVPYLEASGTNYFHLRRKDSNSAVWNDLALAAVQLEWVIMQTQSHQAIL